MNCPRKLHLFPWVRSALLGTAALISIAFVPSLPRNTLRADNSTAQSPYTVTELDSLFHSVYFQDENPYKGSGWKAYQRFHWFYSQRAYPNRDIPPTARAQAWEVKQRTRQGNPLDEDWTPTGPTNMAGRVLCLAWHPTNASVIYAGSASGGLFKTTNGGTSWFSLTDALPSLAVGAVALQPGSPETIYIGTGEGSFNADAVYGAGVFKSTDGGTTWAPTGLSWNQSQGRAINKIVINPSNPQIVYAASSRITGGIFKSTNGGTSWTQYHTGDVKDLIIHPDSLNVLYCADGDPWGNASNGVYRSTDSGVTWTRLSNGLPAATSMGRAQLTMAGSSHQTLYVGISQTLSAGAGLLGVYKTTNAGSSWTLQSGSPNMYGGQGWYNLVIAAHPSTASTVYSSGIDCYKSTDSGVNWVRKTFWSYPPGNSQYAHSDHHDLVFQPGNPNTIIAATDGGLFKSTNGGDTWTALNTGLVTFQFYAMGNDALSPTVAYGGTQDNGTNKYTGSSSWTTVMSGDGGYCNVDHSNSNIVYAETQRGSHYKSTNGGTSWNMIQNGISGYGEWVTPVAMDPTNASCLYTGTTQVYKTTNGGASWSSISPALSSFYVSTIAVAPSNSNVIYAGCGGGGVVWRTTDGGTNWTDITSGLPNRYVTRVAIHPTNPNQVYATFSGYASGHVFKSTNGGTSWTNSSTGLLDIPCNALVIDPNTPTTMYAGTDLGVYRSADGGASWTGYSNGLPNVVVDDISLHPTTGILRAATHGRGMWETTTGSAPSIVVLTPNGGDVWPTGTQQTITWGTGGLGGNARLELNRNYPTGAWEVIISSTPNDGSYAWTVSGALSSSARVRVTSVETPSATDISNSNFTIRGPIISLVTPVGGETMVVGSVDTVAWGVSGTPGTYVVQLNRTYPSSSWTTITTTSSLSAAFGVSGPASSTARVRVYLQSDPTNGDTSSANFSIVDPTIAVVWPNGGESLTPGQSVVLRWNSANVSGTKRVEINRNYSGGPWEMLAAAVSADSLPWTVDQFASSAARIRVTSNLLPAATDISSANFTILTPTIAVITPNGGEAWDIGSTHTIRWSHSNLSGLVNVYYNSAYPSGTWQTVQVNVSADSAQWVVPPPVSGTTRIRVESVNIPAFMDESNGNFSCGSGLTLTSPDGGENWSITGLGDITWTRANANGNVTVQLNRSYPIGTWETLTTSAGGSNLLWTISGPVTSGARVRVFLTANPAVGDTGDGSFDIVSSSLTLLTPNGGEIWNTRAWATFRWTRSNASGPVAVLINRTYPTGGWDTLATSVTADTFRWFVPNDGCSTAVARAKVVWQDVPQIADISNNNFAIVPNLVVVTPNGGEIWPYGSTQVIRWRRSNSPGPVKVLMTRSYPNEGWFYLTDSAPADSFVYTLPNFGESSTARVAVYMQDMVISDTSDANFSIVPSTSLTVTSPNGAEQWVLGSPHTVTFYRSNVNGNVTVQLNRSYPGSTWETLSSGVSGSSLAWTPSGATSSSSRIRIFLNSNPALGDTSDANFSLTNGGSSLTLTVPNGGETWATGSIQTVRFTRSNASGNVAVLLNRNYPSGLWETLTTSVTADTFAWSVSGAGSAASRIRIYLASNPAIGDTSAGNFNIVVPDITVGVPNGGEVWNIGTTQTITFTRSYAMGNASVELNRNYPSGTWEVLSNSVSGSSYSWSISGAATAAARVRVYLTGNPSVGDSSNANFSLVGSPTLSLTSPNGGEVWPIGSTQTVRFTRSNAPGFVAVLLNRTYPSGTWQTLSSTVTADTFAWPVTSPAATGARVRIYLVSNSSVADTSMSNFSIVTPTLTVTAPNGGESWTVGSTHNITLSRYYAIGNATIQLNRNYPGANWETLATNVFTNSFAWTVTSPASSTARIRVSLNSNPGVGDTSNANFSISNGSSLTLTVPVGGESWAVGTTGVVRFTRSNAPGNVAVMLNRTYPGGSWELLASAVSADTFAWNVAGAVTSSARMRVYLASNPAVGDTSAANFSIISSSLVLTAPNGGEVWNIGTSHSVIFVRNNLFGGANIELNRNYPGGTWETVVSNYAGSSYAWTPTGTGTSNARIRVYMAATPSIGDTSNANFSLVASSITVTAPNGGDTLYTSAIYPITWSRSNASGSVTVAVNRSYPSGSWEVLTTLPTGNTYSWVVTGPTTNNARVRVTLNSNPSVGDTSNADFRIVTPQLTVLDPNGGESYALSQQVPVRWSRSYASGNVTVYLNRNYPFGTWETLTTTASADSFLWTVSGATSDNARIRIFLSANNSVYDVSDAAFSIVQQNLTLTSHNNGTYYLGTSSFVTFDRNNASGAVTIQLNRNYPSGTWEVLTTSELDSYYLWSISGQPADAARLRIFLTANPVVGDTSDNNFQLSSPALVLNVPNGGESYPVGGTADISWSRNGLTGSVLVYLNREYPGGAWEFLGSSSTQSLPWTVSGSTSSSARIRIVLQSNNAMADTSAGNFSITGPSSLSLIFPNGGQQLMVGTFRFITFVRNNVPGPVTIQLNRTYPSGTWQTLTTGFMETSYLWYVLPPYSIASRVRIFSQADTTVGDTSISNFIIMPYGLILDNPDGGDTLGVGQTMTLQWTRNQPGAVDVLINRAYPNGTWQTLADGLDSDSLQWTVTPPASANCRIQVHFHADSTVGDTSADDIAIANLQLQLLAPQGGETFQIGQAVTISWAESFSFSGSSARVQLNRDYPEGPWETIANDVTDSTINWIANGNPFDHGRIRVSLTEIPSVFDISDADFRMVASGLTLLYPDDADTVIIGSFATIRWNRNQAPGAVRVQLNRTYPSGTWETLTNNAPADSLNWYVTNPASTVARFRITLVNDTTVTDMSSSNCWLTPPLFFTNPVIIGADTVGQIRNLAWSWAIASSSVRVDISRSGANGPWSVLEASVSGTSYDYHVSAPEADNVRYRVVSLSDTTVRAVSVQRSIVVPSINLEEIGNDTWYIGEQHWVRWTRHNYSGVVNLQMQRMNRSQPWEALAQSSSDSILWTVTGPMTDYAMLRLVLASDTSRYDTADAPLVIDAPILSVVDPNGGEELDPGSEIRLRWVGVGFEGDVSVKLWRGYPVGRLDTLFLSTPNDSSEIWTITGPAAQGCYVIVRSLTNPALWDTSDARFEITGGTAADNPRDGVPQQFSLDAPYPNPFNAVANIQFALPKSGNVKLVIYDVLGREVARLVDEPRVAGYYTVSWDATNAASGVYLVRMTSADFVATRKLSLLK